MQVEERERNLCVSFMVVKVVFPPRRVNGERETSAAATACGFCCWVIYKKEKYEYEYD